MLLPNAYGTSYLIGIGLVVLLIEYKDQSLIYLNKVKPNRENIINIIVLTGIIGARIGHYLTTEDVCVNEFFN